eukprot:9653332-Heterocapsa_arctica.AAC.1
MPVAASLWRPSLRSRVRGGEPVDAEVTSGSRRAQGLVLRGLADDDRLRSGNCSRSPRQISCPARPGPR